MTVESELRKCLIQVLGVLVKANRTRKPQENKEKKNATTVFHMYYDATLPGLHPVFEPLVSGHGALLVSPVGTDYALKQRRFAALVSEVLPQPTPVLVLSVTPGADVPQSTLLGLHDPEHPGGDAATGVELQHV
ncbi:hypothetical protein J6590_014794 [Homalodisca vitripennis]|nr:hypothetical protein J6590_014794 [Homalodisca vitripennis]